MLQTALRVREREKEVETNRQKANYTGGENRWQCIIFITRSSLVLGNYLCSTCARQTVQLSLAVLLRFNRFFRAMRHQIAERNWIKLV